MILFLDWIFHTWRLNQTACSRSVRVSSYGNSSLTRIRTLLFEVCHRAVKSSFRVGRPLVMKCCNSILHTFSSYQEVTFIIHIDISAMRPRWNTGLAFYTTVCTIARVCAIRQNPNIEMTCITSLVLHHYHLTKLLFGKGEGMLVWAIL